MAQGISARRNGHVHNRWPPAWGVELEDKDLCKHLSTLETRTLFHQGRCRFVVGSPELDGSAGFESLGRRNVKRTTRWVKPYAARDSSKCHLGACALRISLRSWHRTQ